MSNDPEHVSNPEAVNKMFVRTVRGGNNKDKNDLTSLYFQQLGNPGDFALYEDYDDHQVATAPALLHSGRYFQFIRGGVLWTVTSFLCDGEEATGNWFNTRSTEQDEGSFQAQAGPPPLEVEESAASANA